ncbi:MAG TPA: TolC family protein [Steroidobacteraceae bacterium]|nr:TolC family protein [Steroidobacteraceae bacterium]
MSFPSAHLQRVCALACALSMQGAAAAAPTAEWPGVLTLAEAIETAISRNPQLQASSYELRAGDARITQARLRPNPEWGLEIDGIAAHGIAASSDERQATLSLSQVLELGDKRGRRVAVARSDRDLAGIEQQARQLDVLAEVTRRFIDVVAAQERVTLARQTANLAQRTAKAIAARVAAARTPQAELSRARIAVIRAYADERQAESVLRGSRRSLAAMWGASNPQFESARADLLTLEPLDPFEAFQDRMTRNPDLTRFASEGRLREAELRLAQSQARPNLTVGVGIRRFQATGDIGLTAGFSMALPLFDRNQGAIEQAQVRRQQTRASERAVTIRVQAEVFALYQQLLSSRDLLLTLQNDALPQARAALDQTQTGYDRGRFSYLELGVAQQELVSLQAAAIDTAADYHRLTAEIERLTAEPIVSPSTTSELP